MPREKTLNTRSTAIHYSIMKSVFCQLSVRILYRYLKKKHFRKAKNYHTIGYSSIKRKNMLKIMSTIGYDNNHFNEINMPSYPQSKMPKIHLGNGRKQWQETKSPFLLMWAMLKLQQLLEFQSGRRGGTSDAFSFWDRSGHVSLLLLQALFQGNNPCQNSHGTMHLCSCSCITLQMEEEFSFKSKMQRGLFY